jgi:multidrug resistance efflux pump
LILPNFILRPSTIVSLKLFLTLYLRERTELSSTLIEPVSLAQTKPKLDPAAAKPQITSAQPAVAPFKKIVAPAETMGSVEARIRSASNQSTVQNTEFSKRANVTQAPQSSALEIEVARQRALLRIQAAITAQDSFEAAALVFCNELGRTLKAHRVSMGLYAKGHTTVSVTNNGDVKKLDKSVSKALAAAMDEAIDQADVITAPEIKESLLINQAVDTVRRLHQGAVVALPLIMQERPEGAFVIEMNKEAQIGAASVAFMQDAVALFGPILSLMHRDELGLIGRLKLSLRRKSSVAMKDESRWVRWSFYAFLISLLVLSFVPISHTVNSAARIEGAQVRTVAAPTQGFIKKVFVRPGDAVQADQPLAELADRELQLERNKLISEAATHDSAYMTAMARNDRGAMMQAQSKQTESKIQLELVDQQLSRGVLTAPIEGVVIEGDLSQMVGTPVERGQSLITVAPKNRFRTIIELDERDIRWVKIGQIAGLSLSALPWNDIEIKIERINPMAVVREGRNVFEIEASIAKVDDADVVAQLRPGLRGVAKVEVGEQAIMNTYARRALEATQRAWWRWAP